MVTVTMRTFVDTCVNQTVDCRPRVKCRLQTKGKTKTRGKMQNEVLRLQTRGKMRKKTAGNTSAFVEIY